MSKKVTRVITFTVPVTFYPAQWQANGPAHGEEFIFEVTGIAVRHAKEGMPSIFRLHGAITDQVLPLIGGKRQVAEVLTARVEQHLGMEVRLFSIGVIAGKKAS